MRFQFSRELVSVLFLIGTAVLAPSIALAADESNSARLAALIKDAKDVPEKDYTIPSWNAMRFALNDAQAQSKRAEASEIELNEAFINLQRTFEALEKRTPVPDQRPKLGLSASIFAADAHGPVNNVALMWATAQPCDRFEVQRATSKSGPFQTIYSGTGTSFHDNALASGTWYYQLIAHHGQEKWSSNVAVIATAEVPAALLTYSNQQNREKQLPEKRIEVGGVYFDFELVRDNHAFKQVLMHRSADGEAWDGGVVVMDRNSHPDLADAKFESERVFYDKRHDQIVYWCHWERAAGYANGKALVATAKPGQPFQVRHVYNPLGIQVRDMSVFIDDDGTGYLVAASNVPGQGANATLYIFRLNETYDDVTAIVAKVAENGYREAPHIIKREGYYYLLFSQAAGWYPSRGGYVSSQSMAGPWFEPRLAGNSSTFSSQSGEIINFGFADPRVPLMMGNRWIRGDNTARHAALPLHFADGFAFYDYVPFLLHDASRSVLIPLHAGRLLSQDKPVESSIPGSPGHEAAKAFDGSYDTSFQSENRQWPFTLSTDLGSACEVQNVQISWHIHKGSEAYYTYIIEGSIDGTQWKTLIDRTDSSSTVVNKTYGFTSDMLPQPSIARYVRLTVHGAHLHNNPNNWYPPTIYEMKVFGNPS
jgi:hypothetical protein